MLVERNAEPLCREVVQRRADRRLRRAVEADARDASRPRSSSSDHASRASSDGAKPVERREHGVRRLAVEAIRRGLAPALDAVVVDDANAQTRRRSLAPPRAMTNGCVVSHASMISCSSFMRAASAASPVLARATRARTARARVSPAGRRHEEREQRVGELVPRLVARIGGLRETAHHDRRQLRAERASRRHRAHAASRARACSHRERVRAVERRKAEQRLVQHDAEGVDVAAAVDQLAHRLLGRHVVRRAHRAAASP